MSITTARLLLRRPVLADFQRFFAIHSDPATNQFNPAGPLTDCSKAETLFNAWLAHWQLHGYGQWAVASRTEPEEIIGFGGIAQRLYGEVERLNLGYRFATSAWGNGYATELAVQALRYALEDLQQPRVFAIVRPAHTASIRVLEKIGMQRIGLLDDVPGQPASLIYETQATPRLACPE